MYVGMHGNAWMDGVCEWIFNPDANLLVVVIGLNFGVLW